MNLYPIIQFLSVYIYMYIYICIYIYIYVCMYVCMYVCVYVCMYVFCRRKACVLEFLFSKVPTIPKSSNSSNKIPGLQVPIIQHKCFPLNIVKFSRKSVLKGFCQRLFLNFIAPIRKIFVTDS